MGRIGEGDRGDGANPATGFGVGWDDELKRTFIGGERLAIGVEGKVGGMVAGIRKEFGEGEGDGVAVLSGDDDCEAKWEVFFGWVCGGIVFEGGVEAGGLEQREERKAGGVMGLAMGGIVDGFEVGGEFGFDARKGVVGSVDA